VADREWNGRVAVICSRGNSSIPAAKLLDARTDADAVSVAGGFEAGDAPVTETVASR
jgi:rhodanese-related sulfurtransferase